MLYSKPVALTNSQYLPKLIATDGGDLLEGKYRILFQNREDALTHPGGDTVLMFRLKEQLEEMGFEIHISVDLNAPLDDYHALHCFNACLPNITNVLARKAVSQGKPLFLHSLQQDVERYYSKALAAVRIFADYLARGQPRGFLDESLGALNDVESLGPITSEYALERAHAVFTCGDTESNVLKKLKPSVATRVTPFGSQTIESDTDGDLFRKTYGLSEFVLCVGRMEVRKNQLMLLAALENEDVPLVFVDGGFTFHPEYAGLCKRFKRRSPTFFLRRLSPEMLASAYQAAPVHCLPSWYDVPGLASLEAAFYGCNLVASAWGAIADYLGDACRYCEPCSPESVRGEVLSAFESPGDGLACLRASRFSWERTALVVSASYLEVCS